MIPQLEFLSLIFRLGLSRLVYILREGVAGNANYTFRILRFVLKLYIKLVSNDDAAAEISIAHFSDLVCLSLYKIQEKELPQM